MSETRHLFTDRSGGVSTGIYESLNLRLHCDDSPENIRENYRRLAGMIGCGRFVLGNQQHTDNVLHVDGSYAKKDILDPVDYVADGLITREPELALVIFTADCVPVLLQGPGVVAAVHAGWRGTAKQIVRKAVREMDCEPRSIRAYIGPCIGVCCYEVGDEVRQAMTDAMGGEAEPFFRARNIDLKGLNRRQLELAGVEQIEVSPVCTYCSHDRYWSHRYTGGNRGTQAAVIVLGRNEE
jgi:YfiH family protein